VAPVHKKIFLMKNCRNISRLFRNLHSTYHCAPVNIKKKDFNCQFVDYTFLA